MRRMAALLVVTILALGGRAAAMDIVVFNPLWDAVASGDIEKADRTLGTAGATPNITDDSGKTPLIYAAMQNNVDMVKLLIHYRARLDFRDPLGNTALAYAAERDSEESVEALVAAGATLDTENRQGATPLMIAAGAGATDVVRFLIDKGASVTKHDYTGRTALDWAERGHHSAQAAALLRKAGTVD